MKNVLALIVVCLLLTACGKPKETTDSKQEAQTEQMMQEAAAQTGMPNVVNFQQKKLMKLILEETDRENLICYAYLQSEMSGKLIFIGKCIGYGVPFSAQFTNPERVALRRVHVSTGHGYATFYDKMPQPDPNGLFMPTSSSATWLLMIDPETGKSRPVYFEPTITVSPFPLPTEN